MIKLIKIVQSYLRVKKIQKFTPGRFHRWQYKQLQNQLSWINKHSPYYSQLAQGGLTDITQYPYMDKQKMMEHFNTLNTRSIAKEQAFQVALQAEENRNFSPTLGNVTVGLSSGTSGNRGIFLVSEEEQAAWAGTILAKLLPAGFKNKERIAFFLRANSNLYESVQSRKIEFAFFDLLDSFEDHIRRLQDYQPTILAAPPSMMRRIAGAVKDNRLTFKPIKIITMAEVLDPLDEAYIEEIFQQKIHQVYQCTEGFLGCSCPYGTIHLNEDLVFIEKEFLNERKTKFYPIITDFRRRTQPIIRYRLNDILTLKSDPCPCGSPMMAIEQIEGRMDDLFVFYDKKEGHLRYVFPDFIRRACITASENIKEYKVIQHTPERIEVQLLLFDVGERHQTEQRTKESLISYLQQTVHCPHIEFKPYIETERLTKQKRIENKMSVLEGMPHVQ